MNTLEKQIIERLKDNLLEAHQDELETDHHGDGPDNCSYCEVIEIAEKALYGKITGSTKRHQPEFFNREN